MAVGLQDRLVEVELVEAPAVERVPVAAAKTFRAYDPDQVLLMAPCLQDWVPDGHLARFVSDLVDEALDLSAIYASYEEERGFPPYDPRLMVKLLIYGYATGTPSSRKLEERTHSDVAVRFLCADQHPDYRPIARFRKRHLDALAELFVQALRLCREAGLVGLGALALDGTKLRANASRHKAMSYERMVKKEKELEDEIAAIRANAQALLADAERVDAQEDERYGLTVAGTSYPRSCSAASSGLPRSVRRRRLWRSRPPSASGLAVLSWGSRARSLAGPAMGVTRSHRSPQRNGTSPIRNQRS